MSVDVTIHDGPLADATTWRVDGAGAVICFEGVVRPNEAEQPISGIRYESYDPMAQMELERLARQAIERFDILSMRVEHSRGIVPIHACSFRLCVAAAHRKAAIESMDWYIDQMKQVVPIWKHALTTAASTESAP